MVHDWGLPLLYILCNPASAAETLWHLVLGPGMHGSRRWSQGLAYCLQHLMRLCSVQLEVLNTLEKNDAAGQYHCVSLLEWFDYRGHVCMAFERLGLSLYDFLRRSGYLPFHVSLVQSPPSFPHQSMALLLHCDALCHTEYPSHVISHDGRTVARALMHTVMTDGAAGPVLWAAIAGERGVSA